MNRKTIYIAGKLRDTSSVKMYENASAFDIASNRLEAEGWHVVNPLDFTQVFGQPKDVQSNPRLLRAVMDAELAAIPHLDAIYLLRGWERSEGAMAELAVALAHGKQILLEGAGE